MRFLKTTDLGALARALSAAYEVYAPVAGAVRPVLARIEPGQEGRIVWNEFRLSEPLKSIWFQPGKVVARWPRASGRETPPRPRAVLGAKGCDLKAVACLDRVLRDHDFKEPAWCAARERNLIVAGDCSACAESCFCTMLGDKPWPTALHDVLLSPVEGGFLAEAGSEKGERTLSEHAALFAEAPAGAVEARDRRRADLLAKVVAQNARFPVRDSFEKSVAKHERTPIWGKLAADCVECNACNLACPTCHCFLLHDVRTPGGAARVSQWDSCFHAGHARMAGGLTPRLQLTERFRNHYHHKFVSFPRNWGITACSGCGRCVEACMGRIDKRECLHRLETQWIPSEVAGEVD